MHSSNPKFSVASYHNSIQNIGNYLLENFTLESAQIFFGILSQHEVLRLKKQIESFTGLTQLTPAQVLQFQVTQFELFNFPRLLIDTRIQKLLLRWIQYDFTQDPLGEKGLCQLLVVPNDALRNFALKHLVKLKTLTIEMIGGPSAFEEWILILDSAPPRSNVFKSEFTMPNPPVHQIIKALYLILGLMDLKALNAFIQLCPSFITRIIRGGKYFELYFSLLRSKYLWTAKLHLFMTQMCVDKDRPIKERLVIVSLFPLFKGFENLVFDTCIREAKEHPELKTGFMMSAFRILRNTPAKFSAKDFELLTNVALSRTEPPALVQEAIQSIGVIKDISIFTRIYAADVCNIPLDLQMVVFAYFSENAFIELPDNQNYMTSLVENVTSKDIVNPFRVPGIISTAVECLISVTPSISAGTRSLLGLLRSTESKPYLENYLHLAERYQDELEIGFKRLFLRLENVNYDSAFEVWGQLFFHLDKLKSFNMIKTMSHSIWALFLHVFRKGIQNHSTKSRFPSTMVFFTGCFQKLWPVLCDAAPIQNEILENHAEWLGFVIQSIHRTKDTPVETQLLQILMRAYTTLENRSIRVTNKRLYESLLKLNIAKPRKGQKRQMIYLAERPSSASTDSPHGSPKKLKTVLEPVSVPLKTRWDFYWELLQSSFLATDLNLDPAATARFRFQTSFQYIEAYEPLIMEECRAMIDSGLSNTSRFDNHTLKYRQANADEKSLLRVSFTTNECRAYCTNDVVQLNNKTIGIVLQTEYSVSMVDILVNPLSSTTQVTSCKIVGNITTSLREYLSLYMFFQKQGPIQRHFLNPSSRAIVDPKSFEGLKDPIAILTKLRQVGRLNQGLMDAIKPFLTHPTAKVREEASLIEQSYKKLPSLSNSFNTSQRSAIQACLTSSRRDVFTLMQGPPGTGKTTCILGLLKALSGRILLCAPSNGAVDELVTRLVALKSGFVVRIGSISDHTSDVVKNVTLSRIVERELQKNPLVHADDLFRGNASGRIRQLQNQLTTTHLRNARIICSTLNSAGMGVLDNLDFDYLIVDEAGQAVETSTLIPMSLKVNRVVLVGDTQQLPPTVLSNKAMKCKYDRSLFERLEMCGLPKQILTIQYRMHPVIRQFPSDYFYQGLLTDAGVRKDPHLYSLPYIEPVVFFNMTQSKEETRLKSKVNLMEVDFILSICRFLKHKQIKMDRIGIIAPYKQQVEQFQQALDKDSGIEVNTVDGFQGRENDIIILSCVRSSNSSGIGFLNDIRRMNVSLTRARYSLLVVGNANTLKQGKAWGAFYDSCKKRKCVVEVGPRSWLDLLAQQPRPELSWARNNVSKSNPIVSTTTPIPTTVGSVSAIHEFCNRTGATGTKPASSSSSSSTTKRKPLPLGAVRPGIAKRAAERAKKNKPMNSFNTLFKKRNDRNR